MAPRATLSCIHDYILRIGGGLPFSILVAEEALLPLFLLSTFLGFEERCKAFLDFPLVYKRKAFTSLLRVPLALSTFLHFIVF